MDAGRSRQADANLHITRGETKLVPPLQHPADEVQVMARFAFHGDHEFSVLGGDLGRVIPFDIASWPVVQVHGFPVRIISGIEGPPIAVEFVAEYDMIRHTIRTDATQCVARGIVIDQRREVGKFVDLTGTVDGVETAFVSGVPGEGIDDWICAKQSQYPEAEEEKNQNVCPTSGGE